MLHNPDAARSGVSSIVILTSPVKEREKKLLIIHVRFPSAVVHVTSLLFQFGILADNTHAQMVCFGRATRPYLQLFYNGPLAV